MPTIKIASASDWSALQDRPPVEVKVSSKGLLRSDARKLAAEVGDRFIHEVRRIEDSLDQVNCKFSHAISCGCTELIGPNRNADGWSKHALKRDMHTYLKFAKAFRDHKNKPTDLYFGRPKVAMFDEERGYGRLLIAYNATKKACEDDLARVADLELDTLDRHGAMRLSHGTKISFDTCSICGNNAKNRSEYCDSISNGGKCSLFGCRNGLSKIAEDGRVQFVHNDDSNLFYDISAIGLSRESARQADRIAYATPFDTIMTKAAAVAGDGAVMGSAWVAEQMGLSIRPDLCDLRGLSSHQAEMVKVALQLASLAPADPSLIADAYDADISTLWCLRSPNQSTKVAAVHTLAQRQEFFGPRVFAKLCGGDAQLADEVAACAYGGLQRLAADDKLAALVVTSDYTSRPVSYSHLLPGEVKAVFGSVSSCNLDRQYKLAAMRENFVATTPQVSSKAAAIALDYLAMKVAFAARILAKPDMAIGFLS